MTATQPRKPQPMSRDMTATQPRVLEPVSRPITAVPPVKLALTGSVGRGGTNRIADVRLVKARLVALGWRWLKVNGTVDAATLHAIRLFQAIKNGHQTIADHRENDGLIDVGRDTHRWLEALNAPSWQLMPAGAPELGFHNVEREDATDRHDWCVSWLVSTLTAAAAYYREDFIARTPGGALLVVNDASLPRGGDTPDHERHETGLACDLRLPRLPGLESARTWWHAPEYDREAAAAQLRVLRAQPLVSLLYFNDPELVAEGLCETWPGHDDHIHVEIRPPSREEAARTEVV